MKKKILDPTTQPNEMLRKFSFRSVSANCFALTGMNKSELRVLFGMDWPPKKIIVNVCEENALNPLWAATKVITF